MPQRAPITAVGDKMIEINNQLLNKQRTLPDFALTGNHYSLREFGQLMLSAVLNMSQFE